MVVGGSNVYKGFCNDCNTLDEVQVRQNEEKIPTKM